jgi:hypothetical protein
MQELLMPKNQLIYHILSLLTFMEQNIILFLSFNKKAHLHLIVLKLLQNQPILHNHQKKVKYSMVLGHDKLYSVYVDFTILI